MDKTSNDTCDRCDKVISVRNKYKLDHKFLCWRCFNKTLLEQEGELNE